MTSADQITADDATGREAFSIALNYLRDAAGKARGKDYLVKEIDYFAFNSEEYAVLSEVFKQSVLMEIFTKKKPVPIGVPEVNLCGLANQFLECEPDLRQPKGFDLMEQTKGAGKFTDIAQLKALAAVVARQRDAAGQKEAAPDTENRLTPTEIQAANARDILRGLRYLRLEAANARGLRTKSSPDFPLALIEHMLRDVTNNNNQISIKFVSFLFGEGKIPSNAQPETLCAIANKFLSHEELRFPDIIDFTGITGGQGKFTTLEQLAALGAAVAEAGIEAPVKYSRPLPESGGNSPHRR